MSENKSEKKMTPERAAKLADISFDVIEKNLGDELVMCVSFAVATGRIPATSAQLFYAQMLVMLSAMLAKNKIAIVRKVEDGKQDEV